MPRALKLNQASEYAGCSEEYFREKILPNIPKYTWLFNNGHFEAKDIDAYFDKMNEKEHTIGCDSQPLTEERTQKWPQKHFQDSQNVVTSGTLTSSIAVQKFAKVATQVTGKRRKAS